MSHHTNTLPKRSEVPHEQTWDIEALFATPQAWEAEAQALEHDFSELAQHQGQLATPAGLLAYLQVAGELELRLVRLKSYASMSATVDGNDTQASARNERANGLQSRYAAAAAFFRPELLALNETELRQWLTTPAFQEYQVKLSRILRGRPHVRSPEVEALLGSVQAPFASERSIHSLLANMDMDFGQVMVGQTPVQVTQGNIDTLTSGPERPVRAQAWEQYADAHLALQHSQAAMYITNIRQNVFLARARHYPDAITASLAPDNIPVDVVTTLLDSYRANVGVWHRYWKLRRDWLGLDTLREYDLKAALGEVPEVSYPQAVGWIVEGMAPLGQDYVQAMQRGLLQERWADYAENLGKFQGAYSNGAGRIKPYIFMTWNNTVSSYSTLAHEVGHSMHSLLSSQEHPFGVPRYTLFHAEVASNFNQAMSRQNLLQKARSNGDTAFEIAILEEAMSNFHRYFFIMPTLAAFELECYRRVEAGQAPSAPELIELCANLLSEGYGEYVSMDKQRSGIMWAEFSTHLYSNFYAYQYATGISAAHQLLQQFEADPVSAQQRYLRFLKSGGAQDPIEALREAGVDMLSSAPVEVSWRTLEGHISRLEELYQQRKG